jgi:hypothetical protein
MDTQILINKIKENFVICKHCERPVDFLNHYGSFSDEQNDYLFCVKKDVVDPDNDMSAACYNEGLEAAISEIEDFEE